MSTTGEELLEIADDAAQARARLEGDLRDTLSRIRSSAEDAGRAWSGSNIGYHATVYYRGLAPRPANSQFSPEWGLMDRWPTHEPDPGWQQMDHHEVVKAILMRAGDADLTVIERDLGAVGDQFQGL